MLNGQTDRNSSGRKLLDPGDHWLMEERFRKSDVNKPVFNIKLAGLKIVDIFMNFRLLTLMKQFLYDFKSLCNYDDMDRDKKSFAQLPNFVMGFGGFAPRGVREDLQELARYLKTGDIPLENVEAYLKHLMEHTSIEPKDQKISMVDICMDLAKYQDNELAGFAIQVCSNSLFSCIHFCRRFISLFLVCSL